MLVHQRVYPIKIPLNPIKPPFSYGFPMVFLWFSYGFPMVNLQVDPVDSLWKGQLIRRHRFPAADGGYLKSEENNLRPAEWWDKIV